MPRVTQSQDYGGMPSADELRSEVFPRIDQHAGALIMTVLASIHQHKEALVVCLVQVRPRLDLQCAGRTDRDLSGSRRTIKAVLPEGSCFSRSAFASVSAQAH